MPTDVMAQNRLFLIAQETLTNVVSANIWGKQEPPPGYSPSTAGAGLLYNVRGGGDSYSGCILISSIQYQCIGETEEIAWHVYLALLEVLQNTISIEHRMLNARIEAQGQLVRQTEPPWPRVFCAFSQSFLNS